MSGCLGGWVGGWIEWVGEQASKQVQVREKLIKSVCIAASWMSDDRPFATADCLRMLAPHCTFACLLSQPVSHLPCHTSCMTGSSQLGTCMTEICQHTGTLVTASDADHARYDSQMISCEV